MEKEMLEIIDSYNEYITRIPNGCGKIVSLFNEEQVSEALSVIVDFSEGLSWLIKVKKVLEQNGVLVKWNEIDIVDFLQEINSGLEVQDYVLVSDLIEYEIIPFFENVDAI